MALGLLQLFLIATPRNAQADHVLVGPGRGLFNVSVEVTLTTPTNNAVVRLDPSLSFGLDLNRGIFPLSGMVVNSPVLDYELTTVTLGKAEARRKLEFGPWSRIRNPQPQVIALFTPAPQPTPTPTPTPVPTPDPRRLADKTLPIADRVNRQMTMFVEEQIQFIRSLPEQSRVGDQGLRNRLALLDDQIQLYKANYPLDDQVTSSGLEALLNVRKALLERGTFAHENY
jgi:hypothetical protein